MMIYFLPKSLSLLVIYNAYNYVHLLVHILKNAFISEWVKSNRLLLPSFFCAGIVIPAAAIRELPSPPEAAILPSANCLNPP